MKRFSPSLPYIAQCRTPSIHFSSSIWNGNGPGDKVVPPYIGFCTKSILLYPPSPVQVVDLLISAFHCMSKLSQEAVRNCSPSPSLSPSLSTSKDMRGPLLSSVTMETTLRLTNHCWEQLSEVRSYNI